MAITVEVIRTVNVKPSTPTPAEKRDYTLSFTDLTNSTMVMPYTLGFSACPPHTSAQLFTNLRNALSNLLTLYYPLAGRFADKNTRVDCNDTGVPLTETKVNAQLSDVIKDPNVGDYVSRFLPTGWATPSDVPLVMQANFFTCGGMVIGLGLSHKITDVPSFMLLIKWLANISNNNSDPSLVPPIYECATLFPPKNVPASAGSSGPNPNIVTKRFVFSPSSVAKLVQKYTEGSIIPTDVQAVGAFLFTRLMISTKDTSASGGKTFLLADAVDMRPAAIPPIPVYSFGNMGWISTVTLTGPEVVSGKGLIAKMIAANKEVNNDVVERNRQSDYQFFQDTIGRFNGKEAITTSSFVGFNLYETQFGWGKPVWLTSATFTDTSLILFDSRREAGMVLWAHLLKTDMVKFEADKVLLSYVSSSPTDY